MILTEAQLDLYVPPPCDRCRGRVEVDWIDVTRLGHPYREYAPGETRCLTPGCCDEQGSKRVELHRCRICRRPVGDIHTAECAPIVLAKVDQPHRVSLEDCYAPSPVTDRDKAGE